MSTNIIITMNKVRKIRMEADNTIRLVQKGVLVVSSEEQALLTMNSAICGYIIRTIESEKQ